MRAITNKAVLAGPTISGSLYPPGRKTVRARFRRGVAELQEASAPMALSQLIPNALIIVPVGVHAGPGHASDDMRSGGTQ